MMLNCVVIEDSAIQRISISKQIRNHADLNLIGDFSNATDAKRFMTLHHVDLIFLDIELPVVNGFSFLDGLKVIPQIIFITSKSEYAVKAFDYDATDYLHKPVTVNRFNKAVKRAVDLFLLRNETTDEEGDYVFIKSNLKKLKVFTSKIKWIEAHGDYVKVVTDENNYMVLSTMKSFENSLNDSKFIRVHKSFIVNTQKISSYSSSCIEIGDSKIPLSRSKKEHLSDCMNFNQ